ncbi:MAG TPA: helix-turn-helix transcriptional regulator [Blastocatellia bacterium]|nr:helix-turn-helix transcriptional regulator [Blastocatellia bacterium]
MEELIKLIQQVMREKGLSVLQIQKRSGDKIKDSFISDILKGKTKTLSVEKVHALAEGLGVDSIDVFKAASGNAVKFVNTEPWPPRMLLKTMEQVVDNPQLTKIMLSLSKMKPSKIKAILKIVESEKD